MNSDCVTTEQQPGIALPTSLATSQAASVSYPAAHVASAAQQLQSAQQQQQSTAALKQRVFTGIVTKLHDNFGFIDEDVFFQTRYC